MSPPALRIARGAAFELCAQICAFTSGPARASLESGKTWIRETRRLAGHDLIARVARYSLTTYVLLATVATETGDEVDLHAFMDRIASLDPDRLRLRLLGADSPMYRDPVDREDLAAATSGDAGARRRVRSMLADGRSAREFDRVLLLDPAELKREMNDILVGWAERVFPLWATEALAAIGRDVDGKDELAKRRSASEVIEAATMGLAFKPGPWVREVVIAPSVALRPFVIPTEFNSTKLFFVSVSDGAMGPSGILPDRLVRVAAALGDATRLRALHELARAEGLSASALAERLGVERTTLFHHLGILRSAGLVAIDDPGDGAWRYRARRDRVEELGGMLRSYLGDETDETASAGAAPGFEPGPS
jgi:DNA-binding transcriptional ArsR family regulator